MVRIASLCKGVYHIVRKRKAENRNPDPRILFLESSARSGFLPPGAMVIFSSLSIKNITKRHTTYD